MKTSPETQFDVDTRAWVERVVIGLKLCPFAPAPAQQGLIRYATSEATTSVALLEDLAAELQRLVAAAPAQIETTLLIHPHVLQDFHDYLDFLHIADETLAVLGLEGEVQIASFHPDYQFAGTAADDIGNATNRSPYPMLHLLREASITRAVDAFGDTAAISATNLATLATLGVDGLAALRRGGNALSPKKLLQTKWTAVAPQNKEKHYLVTRVIEPVSPGTKVVSVEIEAVHSRRIQIIPWRELTDATRWRRGWV